VKALLDRAPDSPERQEAWRLANDRLGMTVQLQASVSSAAAAGAPPSQRLVDAGVRLERNALAGVLAHPKLRPLLAELTPDHFYDPAHRAIRAHLVDGTPVDADVVKALAELDAVADAEGISEDATTELLLRLRDRELRRELQHAGLDRTKELQDALVKIREAIAALA